VKPSRFQKAAWGIALAIVVCAAVMGWLRLRQPSFAKRVYSIGWMVSPPFQTRGDDGQPAGLSVDLVREAARRRGIDLRWVFWQESSELALRKKAVDLWPLITITPERLKAFYISEPYLDSEFSLLVRSDSPYRKVQDLATATIGLANPSIDSRQLHGRLPDARPLARPSVQAVMEDVCQQRADAAFMDSYTAISALLDERGCALHPLRWIAVPEVRSRLGIGAAFENRAVANAIREEIGVMAAEGQLAPIIGRWGYLSGQHLESMEAVLTARRRETRLTVAAALFAFLFVLTCWQTVRITRERNRTRSAERFVREAEQKLRLMANNLKEMVLAYDMNRNLIYANAPVETLTGYSAADLEKAGSINWFHPDDKPRMTVHWASLFQGSSIQDEEYRLVTKEGRMKWMAASWGPILDEAGHQVGVQGSERDITERKLAEEALRESQERYLQAQKLESIGRLAGGVAHDFNNLLTVINGYSDLVFRELTEGDPLRVEIDQIRMAGARAAELTQQLLVFSRKQVSQPKPLDLNQVVSESERMLRRLLGEDIEMKTCLSQSLGQVMADPGQIHQVLMNLVANARGAMPTGGKLLLETADVEIDSAYVKRHPEAKAGPFVLLTVTDTGTGMDEETSRHIFEPFFTTKGPSEGTGLGLATVYGIVKQSQGWLRVCTETGKGSAFHIYLPRITPTLETRRSPERVRVNVGGSETVLVVEDQDEVRRLATSVLTACGYFVLEAADGAKALALVESHHEPIDLLLTDVVLPGMNGRELAECLKTLLPAIKVLYTSGYTQDVIAHRGVLDLDVAYIAKPYTPDGLADKVREVLESS
jgi:PAS domain S-box-containing protein